MTGGGVFLTKKQKKLMLARRRKKKLAAQQNQQKATITGDDDLTEIQNGKTSATMNSDHHRPSKRLCTETTRDAQEASSSSSSQPSTNNSSSTDVSSSHPPPSVPAKDEDDDNDMDTDDCIRRIVIPSHATTKEAKKLRKEARRKARSEGWVEPEKKLVFVDEHGRPQQQQGHEQEEVSEQNHPASTTAAAQEAAVTARPKATGKHEKKKKVFPRINDLLQEERKKEQQLAQKEALKVAEEALPVAIKNRYVALDCEMVGTGVNGKISVLARVSLTDWYGNVLLDTFVQVPTRVTDFRTQWSGVTPHKIQSQNNAMPVDTCRKQVAQIIKGKILVGHALKNDLDAIMLTHPKEDIRDTAKYRYYQRLFHKKWRPRKLRDLVLEHLGMVIQTSDQVGHDSVDDARAAMELFKVAREAWEKELENKKQRRKKK